MRVGIVVLSVVLGCTAGVAGVWGLNHVRLQAPMDRVSEGDPRNQGMDVSVHYGGYINPSVLVFDLESVSAENAPADVFRVFLQFADAVQEQSFERVELAHQGTTKFILPGNHFGVIGREYGEQNPMYTIRTFPEKLMRPDGEKAFGEWEGGMLGVLGGQMKDFKKFNREWYIEDL